MSVALVRALASAGRYDEARPLVDTVAAQHEADVEVTDLQWRVRLAMKDWTAALDAGRRLMALDSATVTRELFIRMIGAAQGAGDTVQAVELATNAVARFPADDELPVIQAQLLRRVGQHQKALATLGALIARNPRAPNAWLQRAAVEADLGLGADTLLATLGAGIRNGEDRGDVARFATSLGASAVRSGAPDALASLRTAVRFYQFAQSAQARDSTAYYLGATSLTLAQRLAAEARSSRQCDAVKEMQAALVDAQVSLVQGGRAFPRLAPERLQHVPTLTEYAEQLAKAFCK